MVEALSKAVCLSVSGVSGVAARLKGMEEARK